MCLVTCPLATAAWLTCEYGCMTTLAIGNSSKYWILSSAVQTCCSTLHIVCALSGCHQQCRCLYAHAYLPPAQEAEQLKAKVMSHLQSLLRKQKTNASQSAMQHMLDLHTVLGLPENANALSLQAGVSAKSSEEQPQDKVIDLR